MISETEARDRTFKVRDGEVKYGENIWWCEDRPQLIRSEWDWKNTWRNLLEFPQYHSIAKPFAIEDKVTGLFTYPELEDNS